MKPIKYQNRTRTQILVQPDLAMHVVRFIYPSYEIQISLFFFQIWVTNYKNWILSGLWSTKISINIFLVQRYCNAKSRTSDLSYFSSWHRCTNLSDTFWIRGYFTLIFNVSYVKLNSVTSSLYNNARTYLILALKHVTNNCLTEKM